MYASRHVEFLFMHELVNGSLVLIPSFFTCSAARLARIRKKKGLVKTACACASLSPEFWGSIMFPSIHSEHNIDKYVCSE